MDDPGPGLTPFQLEVARLFFAQPASSTFLLAGGGAMLANGFGSRPTQDLDFFTRPGGGRVGEARDGFVRATAAAGWTVEIIRDSATFCRMIVHGANTCLLAWRWTRRRVVCRRSLSRDRPTRPKNWPDARSSRCSTGPQQGTSSTSSR